MASGSEILEKQVAKLKRELKQWEKAFAAANGGRKPERDDIRNDAFVSAKYREYDRLRRPIDKPKQSETPRRPKQLRPGSHHQRTALQNRSGNEVSATPSKAWRSTNTLEVVEEEQVFEPTPAFIRCALGPTPQKDGQVLGIFDMAPSATPSKGSSSVVETDMPVIAGTPSRPSAAPTSSINAPSATPQSSSRRRFLDAFAGTPLKRKRDDEGHTPSTARRQFATPSFLRRSFPLAAIDEDTASGGPPFKKRGLVRSLSSLIQGLRKQEESRMDDEWDVMNELEAEERGEALPRPQLSKVLVEDSQGVEMPLGPDQGLEESENDGQDDPGALGADGKPRKVWKKKGLKRQTKRVIMRPVMHKPKKAGDLEDEGGDDVVAETQLVEQRAEPEHRNAEGSDYEDGGGEDNERAPSAPKQKQKKQKASKSQTKEASTPPKKVHKKVNEQAHANFRKLKIKNKNSKANGRGGRFGRR